MRWRRSIMPHVPRSGTDHARLVLPALGICLLAACTSPVDDVTAAITSSASPTPAPATTVGVVLAPRRDPAIVVETPRKSGEVSSPVSVTGTADVVGEGVTVRVLDHGGNELAAIEVAVDCAQGCPATFGTELSFFVQGREDGWIEVAGATNDRPAVSIVPVVLIPA
jgi:immunoglobulin-like protein involved in spore germination